MSQLSVVLQTHDLLPQRDLPNVGFKVDSLRWNAVGGCESATITAEGDLAALEELTDLCRAPVEVRDKTGRVWWGYLYEATVQNGSVEYGATMEGMANYAAVVYDDGKNGRQTTPWAQDSASIQRYGRIEKVFTTSTRTALQCQALRDTKLALLAHPLAILRHVPGGEGQKATLTCKGWFSTLSWRYYTTSGLKQEYDPDWRLRLGGLKIDDFWHHEWGEVYQPVTFAGSQPWRLDSASFWFNWGDTPLHITLSGPGVSASATLQPGYDWQVMQTATLREANGQRPLLQPGVQYSFHFYQDQLTHYCWEIGYAAQQGADAIQQWNGAASFMQTLNYTAMYRLVGFIDNAQQAVDAVTSKGEFITAIDLLDESGIETDPVRDGDQKLGDVVEDLLENGTVNNLRLLCTVTEERRLEIYEEPLADVDSAAYLLRADGKLTDRFGNVVPPATKVVGQWCIRKEGLPPVSSAPPSDSSLVFIESAEYSGSDDSLSIEPRTLPEMFQFFDLEDG